MRQLNCYIALTLFSTLALAPALAAQGPERESSPYLESCATLAIARRSVDTVALSLTSMPCTPSDTSSGGRRIIPHLATQSAVTPAPVPIRLVLTSPRLVAVPQFTENVQSGTATVSIAMVNESGNDLRAPSWLFVSDAATRARGKWLSDPWGRSFASVQTDYRYTTPDYTRADAPSPFQLQVQSYYRLATPGVSPTGVARLPAGDTTAAVEWTLTLNPSIEVARLRLAVRALRASDDTPATPPGTVPQGLLAADRLVTVDSVATPFVHDLLRVGFADTLSALARQILLDRIAGRVVGTQDGDLVVQVDSSADGRAVLRTWSRWRLEIAQGLIRKVGVVTPGNVLEATAAARGMRPQSDTVLPQISEDEMWKYSSAYLVGDPSPGATPAEVRLALATVGARPVAEHTGWRNGTIARLDGDTSYDAHAAAARRLHWLPVFRDIDAWPAYDPRESSAFHPFSRPPPKSEGTAWRDPRVTQFVAKANLPNVHAIRDLLVFRDRDLVFFSVTYGSASEVYPSRTGLRVGSRIGWMGGTDSLVFRFRSDDTYLQGELIDTLLAIE